MLLFSALLAFFLLSQAQAQQTVVRLQVDGSQPVESGDTFRLTVLVENVEHVAAFAAVIGYDPDRLEPVKDPEGISPGEGMVPVLVEDLGQFIMENGERQSMICRPSLADTATYTITITCNTAEAPLCLGGPPGASGSGVLGRVVFESKGGGLTTLELTDAQLVLDDLVSDCSNTLEIEHTREDATVELIGGGGGSNTVVIVVAVGVGAAVIIIALAGVAWYRRRPVSS
ncbi:MAG: hypothetical protein HY723_04380 [Chloroflexi bacterium]|nr:hypothetical protein [Chloroflexota bacterium]